ncbi:MAG: response regulator [Methanobacterium sp.]
MGPVKILLVEDNPADARLITDYFEKSGTKIKHVTDGAEALDYLYQRGEYQNASLPQIVILDMNIPKVDGMTVLETIKDDENLNKIAVIVFGTSGDSKEVKKAYKSYANCYIVKPIDYDDFENKLESIAEFWLKMVTLPSKL